MPETGVRCLKNEHQDLRDENGCRGGRGWLGRGQGT